MVRTQVQLTDAQAARLRALAAHEGISIAEVVRRLVDEAGLPATGASRDERRQRAIDAIGRFASGRSDVSSRHDTHLAEAYAR